jgi:hypothetical protein
MKPLCISDTKEPGSQHGRRRREASVVAFTSGLTPRPRESSPLRPSSALTTARHHLVLVGLRRSLPSPFWTASGPLLPFSDTSQPSHPERTGHSICSAGPCNSSFSPTRLSSPLPKSARDGTLLPPPRSFLRLADGRTPLHAAVLSATAARDVAAPGIVVRQAAVVGARRSVVDHA